MAYHAASFPPSPGAGRAGPFAGAALPGGPPGVGPLITAPPKNGPANIGHGPALPPCPPPCSALKGLPPPTDSAPPPPPPPHDPPGGKASPPKQNPPAKKERRKPQGVKIHNIRDEVLTDADARERLSSYIVLRLEKEECPDEFDDEGRPRRPTWKYARRVEEADVSHEAAARKVRELARTDGRSVHDKKRELGGAIQRQLDEAARALEGGEPDARYHYTIVQLESTLRPHPDYEAAAVAPRAVPGKPKKGHKGAPAKTKCVTLEARCVLAGPRCVEYRAPGCGCKGRGCGCTGLRRVRYKECGCGCGGREGVAHKHPYKWERVSVTVYFMRTPRPGENAMQMLEDWRKSFKKDPEPPPPPPPPPSTPPSSPAPPPSPQINNIIVPLQILPPMEPRLHFNQFHLHAPPPQTQGRAETTPKKPKKRVDQYRPHHSPSSVSSDDYRDPACNGYATPASPVTSGSRRGRDGRRRERSRSRSRRRSRPDCYGFTPARRHSKRDLEWPYAGSPAMDPYPVVDPPPPAVDRCVERTWEQQARYLGCRDDNRAMMSGALGPKVVYGAPRPACPWTDHEAARGGTWEEDLETIRRRLDRSCRVQGAGLEEERRGGRYAYYSRRRGDGGLEARPGDRLWPGGCDDAARAAACLPDGEPARYRVWRSGEAAWEDREPWVLLA